MERTKKWPLGKARVFGQSKADTGNEDEIDEINKDSRMTEMPDSGNSPQIQILHFNVI
jgi:hypothetical protein